MIKASSTHWPSVLTLWLCGVFAAMQFSKVSIAFVALQGHYAVSPANMGWTLSVVGLAGLLGGVTMGLFAPSIGFKRLLLAGLGLGAVLALLQSLMLPFPLFLGTRVLEGASHLAVVVAAPTLMAASAAPGHRSLAMGLWSTFFGAAFAITAAFGPPVLARFDVSALFVLHAAALSLMWVAVFIVLPEDEIDPVARQRPRLFAMLNLHRQIYTHWATALPGLCFWCYTFMALALLTFIPPLSGANRDWIAAVLPLSGVCGTFCAGWLAQYWRSPLVLVRTAFTAVGVAAVALGMGLHLGVGVAPLALLLMFAHGLSGGASFALIPYLNPQSLLQARANGAVAQMGNLGATLGPPTFALALSAWGGRGLMGAVLLCSLAGLGLAFWGARQMKREH